MEDQQSDTSDLTTESDASPTPQGKAARSKHRLPRAALRQATNTGTPEAQPAAVEAVAEVAKVDEDKAPDVEAAAVESTDETTSREDAVAEEPATEAATTEEPVTEEPVTEAAAAEEPVTEAATTETAVTETAAKPRIRFSMGRRKAAEEPTAEEPAAEEPVAEEVGDGEAVDDTDATTSDDDADAPEPILVPHRTAGRPLKVALIVAAAVFVGAAAFTGATLKPYLTDRAIVHTKFQVAETAARAITTLWTYTPDDMAKLPERSAKYLGGDFADEYRKYIDAIVAPNKQAQISNNTQVLGAAIESLSGDEATAIVYTNSVATSPVTKGAPSLRYLSYRLAMKRQGSDWLITRMTALTSLDVTPRI